MMDIEQIDRKINIYNNVPLLISFVILIGYTSISLYNGATQIWMWMLLPVVIAIMVVLIAFSIKSKKLNNIKMRTIRNSFGKSIILNTDDLPDDIILLIYNRHLDGEKE